MKRAVYAGSFDPPTNGHMFMIQEGAALFDELVVAIGVNPDKKSTFSLDERLELLRQATRQWKNVRVDSFANKYLVKYAASVQARYVLRGIRNANDFEYEKGMRHMNQGFEPTVTTLFLVPPRDLAEISSSFVKGLVGPEGWHEIVQDLVPAPVMTAMVGLYGDRPGGQTGD
jgi:pantetheine-phosphate adenylyltransferase